MAVENEIKRQQSFSERALNLIKEKLGERRLECQLCGENNWKLQEKPAFVFIVAPDITNETRLSSSKQEGLPLVVMTCRSCGNTLFINTLVLGL